MARKSRKIINAPSQSLAKPIFTPANKNRIPTAIYARLSNENNGHEDESSIQNQISLIQNYLTEHSDEYELFDIYVDNGHTGTNFERPDFLRLMDDVNHGRIGCILVKDLSRFGRNYIETGVYIENILPKLDVKLIAVNDSFDSSKDGDRQSISVPIKNMVNEMYSRDLSRKMFTANTIRRMKKDVLPLGPSPYGYYKNKAKTHFLPDENSDYVRVIFQWVLLGVSYYEIADRLNLIGAPVARNLIEGRAGDYKWTSSAVKKIIANPVYTGSVCLGRCKRTKLGTQRGSIEVPKEQWVIHENTHEALVPKPDFDLLYERKMKNRILKKGQMEEARKNMVEANMDFNNMVYCAECQKKMITKWERHKDNDEVTHVKYVCTNRKKTEKSCYNVVYNDFLRVIVMDQVLIHVKLLSDQAELIKRIKGSGDGKDICLSIDKQIQAAAVKLEEKKELEAKTYVDYKEGLIEIDDFKLIHERCVLERQKVEKEYKNLSSKKDAYVRIINQFLSMMNDINYNPGADGFDERLVKELVERINVYHDNKFEVIFKNRGYESLIKEALNNHSLGETSE
ncbi:MAG: recombinase family protein [Lachnospiraceae bacterium]|nr:recombinase family protein [Lachnospiraceae bacterium]